MSKFELNKIYEDIIKCNKCGFCQQVCPTYQVTGKETEVARGRISVLRDIIEGNLKKPKEAFELVSECLLCKACITACFSEAPTDKIIIEARASYLKAYGQSPLLNFIFKYVLPNPKIFYSLMKLISKSGYAPIIDKYPKKFLTECLKNKNNRGSKITYFVGCGINYFLPEVGVATMKLIEKKFGGIAILDNLCCGLPPYSYGNIESAKNLAERNIEVFEKHNCKTIITECASCSSFLKTYPELLSDDDKYRERAIKFAEKVKDLTEILEIKFGDAHHSKDSAIITYHYPCHLSRGQKINFDIKEFLKKINGIKFVELPEADWCCGGAGTYTLRHSELSEKILARKMNNLEKTKADILLTSCPACIIQLKYGIRKRNMKVMVMHLAEFLNANL